MVARAAARRGRESARAARRRTPSRARRRSRSGSRARPARPVARRPPRRASSATAPGVALAEPAHAGVVLDVDPRPDAERARRAPADELQRSPGARPPGRHPAAGRRRSSCGRQRAHHEQPGVGELRRAARRPRRRRRPRASSAPPASAARAALDRAVAVAVGLDDRAERGAAVELRSAAGRSCARSRRASTSAVARATAHRALRAQRLRQRRDHVAGDHRLGGPDPAGRDPPGALVGEDGGAGGLERLQPPRASSAAIVPASTSPVPAVASAGLPPAVDRQPLARVGDDRVVALEHDDRAAALGGLARARPAGAPRSRPTRVSSRRPSSPACGVSTVAASRRRSDSSRRRCALRPSASITSGASILRGQRPAPAAASRRRARARGRARPRRARSAAASDRLRGVRAEAPRRSGEAARHHLGQLHLEDRLEVVRHRDGRVAGAGADRRLGRHADGAGEPARAAGDQHLAGGELGRAATRARRERRAPPSVIRPAGRLAGAPRGIPIAATRSSPRVRLAGRDPVPELGGVEGHRDVRLDRDPSTSPVEASTPGGDVGGDDRRRGSR